MSAKTYARSFAGGEITPELYGHLDLVKFQIGLKTCKNFLVLPQGAVQNRPGFKYASRVKVSVLATRLIEYAIDSNTTMIVEVGLNYMRFLRNGNLILEPIKAISGFTIANPGVININAHGYINGQWVKVTTTNFLPIDYYTVVVVDANHFRLQTIDGVNISTLGLTFTIGDVARVYEIVTTYSHNDVFDIHYAQSGATMTLVHTSYVPRELKRITDTNWALTDCAFVPTVVAPTAVIATPTLAGAVLYSYVVTSLSSDAVDESAASTPIATCNNDLTLSGHFNTITWTGAAGVTRYNVYKASNGLYGYIGQAEGLSLIDNNIVPDISKTPPIVQNPFNAANEYPGAVSYFEQRRVFAGSNNRPLNVWMTKTGTESNLSYSIPTRDDDAIRSKVFSRLFSTIRHIVPMSDLMLLTSGVEFRTAAQNSDALTPSSISFKPDSYEGANLVQPVTLGSTILYAQARGARIRELILGDLSTRYQSNDICVLAPHLFEGRTIVDMARSLAPNKMLWVVRDDGLLLALTYLPEQQVAAWQQIDTDGDFKSIANASESSEDRVYVIVDRVIQGTTVRMIEYSTSRRADSFFVDAGVLFSYLGTGTTITNLQHLEGKTVSVLVAGAVFPQKVVTGGQITLDVEPQLADLIHIGLPYNADLETLPLALALRDGSFGQAGPKNINQIWARLVSSSGLFAGPAFDKLTEFKQRTTEDYGAPPALITELVPLKIKASWSVDAPVCIRQSNPLPLEISALVFDAAVGG